MSRYRSLSTVWTRPLLAAVAAVLMLTPTIAAFEHPAHESSGAGVVHAEAAHPEAPAHVEQEEHEQLKHCAVCVEAGRTVMEPEPPSSELAAVETHGPATDPTWAAHPEVGPTHPRGPPA